MSALIFRIKGSSVIPSLTLRKIIDGCRGERTWRRGVGEEQRRRDGSKQVSQEAALCDGVAG